MLREHTMKVNFSQILSLTLTVAIFQNGRQNIHYAISQFLHHLEKWSWCLNIHFQDQALHNYKYANLGFDLNSGYIPKWPSEYTSFNISVLNSCRKKIMVCKHTFSGPRITKKTMTNTQIWPLTLMVAIFPKWPPVYTYFNISVSNSRNSRKFNIWPSWQSFFPKWPPKCTCFNISVSNWFKKKDLGVWIYIFSINDYTKGNYKYAKLIFLFQRWSFFKMAARIYMF